MTVLMERPSATDERRTPEPEELLDTLELPPGYKAELVEGKIIVTPPPSNEHQDFFVSVAYDFNVAGWRASGNTGVITPLGNFIPDLTVARKEFFRRTPNEHWLQPDGIALVGEITSTNALIDRETKRRGYAQAQIPLYLLIDRKAKETVLFSDPKKDDYGTTSRRPIDEPVPLPEPFSFTLEDFAT